MNKTKNIYIKSGRTRKRENEKRAEDLTSQKMHMISFFIL